MLGAAALPLAAACSPTARNDISLPLSLCGTTSPTVNAGDEARAQLRLRAVASTQALTPDQPAPTRFWGYNGTHPGPLLRVRQGDTPLVVVENKLAVPTTVHWHGLRLHNGMDGVPHFTQAPIAPDASFVYKLLCRDAGTFWYHPHLATHEQLVRGLSGPIIVDEQRPPAVDAELTWVIADWLLDAEGQLRGDFDDTRDMSHAGRIGNKVTINGRPAMFAQDDPDPLRLARGARVRLRLINAASARVFALKFSSDAGFELLIAALDGHPCPLHAPPDGTVMLAPAQRVDLFFDMPDGTVRIEDRNEPRRAFLMRALTAQGVAPRRAPMVALPANPWIEPNLDKAREVRVVFEGGARSTLKEALVANQRVPIAQLVDRYNMAWTVNGVANREHDHEPFVTVACGETVVLRMSNDTQFAHPIHLLGYHFKVLAIDGRAPAVATVRDTLMMEPHSSADVAFVADNPGDWMFHCHILQHQAGGMSASIRVSA